jgi:hypothetical protein
MKKVIFLIMFIPIWTYSQLPKDIINQNCFDSGWPDEAADMLVTNDAMYFLAEQLTNDGNQNYDNNIVLVKTNSGGSYLWQEVFGGSSSDNPISIIKDDAGHIYIGASTISSDGDAQSAHLGGYDAWVIKIDASGTIIWEK